jgi:predicted phage terminase large subunit-like protein
MNLPPVIVHLPDGSQTSIVAIEAPDLVDEQI